MQYIVSNLKVSKKSDLMANWIFLVVVEMTLINCSDTDQIKTEYLLCTTDEKHCKPGGKALFIISGVKAHDRLSVP